MEDTHEATTDPSEDRERLRVPEQDGGEVLDHGLRGEVEAGCRAEPWFSDRDRR